MKLKFIRNSDFVILADAEDGSYKIKLLELFVEFLKITRRELDALDRGEPYIMPFLQGKQMIHTIPEGRLSYLLQDLCARPLPKKLQI